MLQPKLFFPSIISNILFLEHGVLPPWCERVVPISILRVVLTTLQNAKSCLEQVANNASRKCSTMLFFVKRSSFTVCSRCYYGSIHWQFGNISSFFGGEIKLHLCASRNTTHVLNFLKAKC